MASFKAMFKTAIAAKSCKAQCVAAMFMSVSVLVVNHAAAQQTDSNPSTEIEGSLQPTSRTEALAAQRAQTESELQSLQAEIELSQATRSELESEVDALEKDAAAINRELIETSAKSRQIEDRIERTATRLNELRVNEESARQSLRNRRGQLIEVIAALQRMGHRPPPALLVTPEDALSSVRSAILLGAILPPMRQETQILSTELNNLIQIRQEIAQNREQLASQLEALAEEEMLLELLFAEKRTLSGQRRAELARQAAKAAELAGRATSLQSLIDELGSEIDAVKEAQEAAKRAEERRRAREESRIAEARESVLKDQFSDMSRLEPAVAFPAAKGLLPKPVSGVVIAQFDQRIETGEISRGLSIATRSDSRVSSPTDGWVIYAGPFRSYGQLLIINAGDGYHIVMSGMDQLDVELGQFVLAGEPIGAMGGLRIAAAGYENVNVGSRRPVLYVEFRKDGTPIDPSPWWAAENARGSDG